MKKLIKIISIILLIMNILLLVALLIVRNTPNIRFLIQNDFYRHQLNVIKEIK